MLGALVLAVAMAPAAFAQEEEPSRLRCDVPKDWKPAGDGKTFILPGKNVAVSFGASTPFAGTAEEWMDQYWQALGTQLKFVGEPVSAPNGKFLARIGAFQQAGGSNAWLCVNTLVDDGRGEAVMFMAGTEAEFGQFMPAFRDVLGSAKVAAATTPAAPENEEPATKPRNPPSASSSAPLTMDHYEFIPPDKWQMQKKPDHILLTQSPDAQSCVIQILPPQPSSGDLEREATAMMEMMYPNWGYARGGEQQYTLTKGVLPGGLEYCMKEAQRNATDASGRYLLEDGAALVIKAGKQVALVAVRHRAMMAHNNCLNRYETWRRFFNSFTVKGAAAADVREQNPAERIIGVWSQSGGGAIGEYVFAANGHFARAGGLGSASTSSDDRYEYLHIRSHAWDGDGAYAISGNELTLRGRGDNQPELVRFRFEQANHGGTGWKDRLWLLKTDRHGQNEVCYEKKSK